MFNSRFKKIVLTTVVAALLSSCNLAGVLKNQKNLFGRYYDGALNEKELKSFNPVPVCTGKPISKSLIL